MTSHGPIRIRIDRVILEGLPVGHRDVAAIRRALETSLADLVSPGGAPAGDLARGGVRASLAAPVIRVRPGSGPAAIGRALARSLHAALFVPSSPPSPAAGSTSSAPGPAPGGAPA